MKVRQLRKGCWFSLWRWMRWWGGGVSMKCSLYRQGNTSKGFKLMACSLAANLMTQDHATSRTRSDHPPSVNRNIDSMMYNTQYSSHTNPRSRDGFGFNASKSSRFSRSVQTNTWILTFFNSAFEQMMNFLSTERLLVSTSSSASDQVLTTHRNSSELFPSCGKQEANSYKLCILEFMEMLSLGTTLPKLVINFMIRWTWGGCQRKKWLCISLFHYFVLKKPNFSSTLSRWLWCIFVWLDEGIFILVEIVGGGYWYVVRIVFYLGLILF